MSIEQQIEPLQVGETIFQSRNDRQTVAFWRLGNGMAGTPGFTHCNTQIVAKFIVKSVKKIISVCQSNNQ